MSKKIGVYYLHHERGYDGLIAEFFVKHDDRIIMGRPWRL